MLNLHYRVAGGGPPLFLLHPSPHSSAFMQPLMRRLAGRVTVIAPDTPGFGASDPSAAGSTDLAPYVQAMIALRQALGLRRAGVYGSATGAQIAIEWAKADAPAISGVLLDNAAHFTDEERERISDGYFPDVAPAADGGHLARAWQAAHDSTLFFPWHLPADGHRIAPRLGSAAAMDLTARAYLAAGPGYSAVYQAALANERAERVQPIRAPVVILRWRGSILRPWSDRMDSFTWRDNVVMAHCGPTADERWACLERHLAAVLPDGRQSADGLRLDTGAIRYVDADLPAQSDADDRQIRYRLPVAGLQPGCCIALHGFGGESRLVSPAAVGANCVRIDLPGHGGSTWPANLSAAHCTQAVRQVVTALDARPSRICGVGGAARIARQVAEQEAGIAFRPLNAPWLQGVLPDLTPETSGAHLWRGWHWLRGQYLARAEAPPAPARLTLMLLALLDSQDAYRKLQP